ncbi:hypothetical protein [Paenarthrobacter nicotinovorans]|nr:hypothetical protein [Paenarthrobacter nicotinovorans]
MTTYLDIEDALQVTDRYGFHIRDVGLLASAPGPARDNSYGY